MAEKQIQQMIAFILQEAQEKAKEIEIQAEEEFTIEKQRLVEAAKKSIRTEFDRKEKQVIVQKKISRSNEIKNARLSVLKLRDEIIQDLVKETTAQLVAETSDPSKRRVLLSELTLQALLQMNEPSATVRVKDADRQIMEQCIPDVENQFQTKSGSTCKLSLGDPLSSECAGGVIVTAFEDRIVCNNTLDQRLKLAFEQNLPTIRKTLLPTTSRRT